MTPTNDADRETLVEIIQCHWDADAKWDADAVASEMIAAGFRRAPSAPTLGTGHMHNPYDGKCSSCGAQADHCGSYAAPCPATASAPTPPEAGESIDAVEDHYLDAIKRIEAQRDAALADAAALREVVRREADGARRVVAGACSSMEFPIDWWQRKLDRLNAALAASPSPTDDADGETT